MCCSRWSDSRRKITSVMSSPSRGAIPSCETGAAPSRRSSFCAWPVRMDNLQSTMATPIKYPPAQKGDDVLLCLREEYEQAVLDLFEADETKEIRPALEVIGHTSNFLDNLRLPVHRWFRYSAGFSAEWVKWLLAERKGSELRVLNPFVGSGTTCLAWDEMGCESYGLEYY